MTGVQTCALPISSAAPSPAAAISPVPPAQIAVESSKATPGEAAKPAPEVPAKVEKSEPVIKPTVPVADSAKTGFAVQLGVFADAENAKITIEKMKDAKLPVYSDSIPIKSGSATRVRIGPFPTREKADSALVQIKLAGGDGKIVPLQ